MMIIYDDHTGWSYMMIIYDNHQWSSSYVMIIYDAHIWWLSMIIIIYVIWDHLGVIWETFGNHLGSIWETSGRVEAEEASGGQISYYLPHSRTECKSSIKISISRRFFEGTIEFGCIFTAISARGSVRGSQVPCKAPLPRPWEPL